MKKMLLWPTVLIGALTLVGCGGSKDYTVDLENQLAAKDKELAEAQSSLESTQARLERERIAREKAEAEARAAAARGETPAISTDLFPPAKTGECYTRVFIEPVYRTEQERILVKEASYKIETTPPVYDWVEEQVLVKPASSRLEVVPAVYEWTEEKVLVEPERVVWKKGRGPIEKIDGTTGEIMCRVVIPARYETRKKRIVKTPATTRTIEIPAEYKTVKVRKLVTPAQERRIEIPAEYKTVTKTILVSDGHMEWREVLCETNMDHATIMDIQRALAAAGHDPGPIDGIVGPLTLAAVADFQREKGLPVGGLTIETIESLGVNPR